MDGTQNVKERIESLPLLSKRQNPESYPLQSKSRGNSYLSQRTTMGKRNQRRQGTPQDRKSHPHHSEHTHRRPQARRSPTSNQTAQTAQKRRPRPNHSRTLQTYGREKPSPDTGTPENMVDQQQNRPRSTESKSGIYLQERRLATWPTIDRYHY